MILEWRTRLQGGVPNVDIRITRESDDVWCMDEIESAIGRRWFIRASSGSSSSLVNIAGFPTYDPSNDRFTITYSNVPRRYLAQLRGVVVNSDHFYLAWDPRALRPASGNTYQAMPDPDEDETFFDDSILCPPEELTTDSNWSSLIGMTSLTFPAIDSNWSSLVRMTSFDEPSTDSDWSFMEQLASLTQPATDSDWSSLLGMTSFGQPATDSNWSSLEQMTPAVSVELAINLPSRFVLAAGDDTTFDIRQYVTAPAGAILSYSATESSQLYSVSTSGDDLVFSAGNAPSTNAGNVTVTVSSGSESVSDSAQVAIIGATDPENTPPFVNPQIVADRPFFILTGGSNFAGSARTGEQFEGGDPDPGDTLIRWQAERPSNGLFFSTGGTQFERSVSGTGSTGQVILGAVQDASDGQTNGLWNGRRTSSGAGNASFWVRLQDNHGAWSDWEIYYVRVYQPVGGIIRGRASSIKQHQWFMNATNSNVLRNDSSWQYIYLGPRTDLIDRYLAISHIASWPGSISFSANRYKYQNSDDVLSISSSHPTVDVTLNSSGLITVTPKPGLVIPGQYLRTERQQICTINLFDDSFEGINNYSFQVFGEIYIAGPSVATTDSEWSTLESMPSLAPITTDSNWSTLEQMAPEPSTDSEWSSLVDLSGLPALNSPPVCAPLSDRTVVQDSSIDIDLTSFLSDPDGDSITIAVSENDSNISITNRNASAHSFTINGLSVGTAIVTVTPTDEHGLRGANCTFRVTVREAGIHDCYPVTENVLVGQTLAGHLPDALYQGNHSEIGTPEFQAALRIQTRNTNSSIARIELSLSENNPGEFIQFLGVVGVSIGVVNAQYRLTNNSIAPTFTTPWCDLTIIVTDPSTDSEWSTLEQMTPEPGTDSEWSGLEEMTEFSTDGPWSDVLSTVTKDGPWASPIGLLSSDGPWSEFISNISSDGPWSDIMVTPTRDGPWSSIITTLSLDGPWSDIMVTPTRDGPWSSLVGLITRDGPWSSLAGLITRDGPWSDLIGPIICDSLWSPFAVLGTQDGPWSSLVDVPTTNGLWSALIGPIICDSAWSLFAELTIDSEWSEGVVQLTPFVIPITDSLWSALSNVAYLARADSPMIVVYHGAWASSNVAYRPRRPTPQIITARSSWSVVSAAAFQPRAGAVAALAYRSPWSALSNAAHQARAESPVPVVYHGVWQSSNVAHSPRQHGATLIVGNSRWSSASNVSFQPRVGPLEALVYAEWSIVSNIAYRPRVAALAQMVYRSEWSPVSNVARQEREVLSAIGGAIPFLHIYEARRGLVQVRRLVDHPTGDLFAGAGFEAAAVSVVDRDDDRVLINPGITLLDLQDGDVALDVYRTTDSSVSTSVVMNAYRFYLANMEGVDPSIRRVYYDVTPSALFTGAMPYRVRATATATALSFQRYAANGDTDGAALTFSFSTASGGAELVVIAVTPQHDDTRLSRIVYLNRRVNNWYYYHGVPEIYVSEPVQIVADEDAFSYNGRDSANFQSPPHVGYASALVRQHQSTDNSWFEQLLDRNHVITGQRVHIMLRDADGNYGKDFTGILQSPPLQHQDNIYDWRVTIQDPTTLMVQSFANSATLLGPQDAISTRTIGALIRTVCQAYAGRVSGLTLDDVLDPDFKPDNFPVPLAWFWTDYESERDILQRLVNTQGPPTGFYVNNLGQLTFTGCEDRATPIQIGGAAGIPVSQVVSFSDHVVDVANDARIPVSLHGWVLPDIATTPAQIYEDPDGLPEAVQVQLFETYSDNAIFDLARGGGITFDTNGEYRYRVRTGSPVLPTEAGDFRITGASGNVTVNQVAANLLEIVATGVAGQPVPAFQLLGAELKHFRTIENWTSQTVREENQTRFSRYLYHQREFSYGGYNSIAVRDAQLLADWVVRYYRKGIKTMTLQLFCSNHVQEALRLEPDRTPVHVSHNYGAGAPEQWIVRSRKRVYRDGHFWIELVLDEDVMYSLGLEHSPLCANYLVPTEVVDSATYAVSNSGALTYTGDAGAALVIPQFGLLSAAPDLAATVLPIAAPPAAPPQTVLTRAGGSPLFQIAVGADFKVAHFDLTRLEALNDSAFYADGLRANGLSIWLVHPKVDGDPYWAVMNLNLRSNGFTGNLPAAFHFLRVRYAALGAHSDVVLSFVAPNMTIHDAANHWITVAQEQPWLGEDAAAALRLHQHVIILDWQAFPMDAPVGSAGLLESPAYVNDAVISVDASPSTNVGGANGAQIARRFGRA